MWNVHKSRIVEDGNFLKFTQGVSHHQDSDPEPQPGASLKSLLLETADRELVEVQTPPFLTNNHQNFANAFNQASPEDRIWGIGFSIEDAPTSKRSEWGQNLLGKALVNARKRIQSEAGQKSEL